MSAPSVPAPTPPPGGGAASSTPRGEVRPRDEDLDGIEIDILGNGTVRLHARCRPGQDPAECAERVRFLVDALGVPLDSVVTEVSPAEDPDAGAQDGPRA